MIVNFIGVDKTGKTTLIDEVALELGWGVQRYRAPFTRKQIQQNVQRVITEHEAATNNYNMLYERWNYPEDLIYGPVIEGKTSILEPLRIAIEHRLLPLGCLFVYTTAPLPLIRRRFKLAKGDYYVPVKKIGKLEKAYLEFLEQTAIPYITIDTDRPTIEENVDTIMLKIREALVCKSQR